MKKESVEISSYFDWLCSIVNFDRRLAKILYGHIFEWFIPNDDNRAADGRHLREQYLDDMGALHGVSFCDFDAVNGTTILEMLIGLAYRLEWELTGGEYERSMADCFWLLIENLGWDRCLFRDIPERIYILNKREYNYDGSDGGLFPLRCPKMDQRGVEIWYQMSYWVKENFPM